MPMHDMHAQHVWTVLAGGNPWGSRSEPHAPAQESGLMYMKEKTHLQAATAGTRSRCPGAASVAHLGPGSEEGAASVA
jgi:hypothetical protein